MRKSIDTVNHQGKSAEPAAATVGADAVVELVHAVMHQLRGQQYQALRDGPAAEGTAISHMDTKVLGYFGRHPGATQSDLAAHSGRDKAQLARLVKGLRERGLLDGTPDADDKRNLRLQLTADGQALQRALARQARRLAEQAVAGFSAEERAQLHTLLQRMRANLAAPDDTPR